MDALAKAAPSAPLATTRRQVSIDRMNVHQWAKLDGMTGMRAPSSREMIPDHRHGDHGGDNGG